MGGRGEPIRVLLAEDHVTVRQGLKLLIDAEPDLTVVGEASDGEAAVRQAGEVSPNVVVMDISMPGMSGLLATRAIREAHPDMAVVALTRHDDHAYLQELRRAGAAGYVLKRSPSSELLQAIRTVAAGGRHVDAALEATARCPPIGPGSQRSGITARETDVLRRIAMGFSNKEIAAELDVSVKTIEVHKANAMRKLALRGRIDIVRYALLHGWLKEP